MKKKLGTTDVVVLGIVVVISIVIAIFATIIEVFGDPGDSFFDAALLFALLWGMYRLGRSIKNGG